jgi:hypothetical protein
MGSITILGLLAPGPEFISPVRVARRERRAQIGGRLAGLRHGRQRLI